MMKSLGKSIAGALVGAVDQADKKLIRASMKLMALKSQSPKPVHPKNILRNQGQRLWFEDYLPGVGARVIDLGAGSGSLSCRAVAAGASVVAIESNPDQVKVIEHFREKLTEPDQLEILSIDLESGKLPLASNEFDLVICHDLIEHLNHRHEILSEVFRCLKMGGKLVINAPNRLTKWKQIRGSVGLSMLADEDHKIEYSREEFLKELEQAGFEKLVFEAPTVIDAPINGIFDLAGPVSMKLYEGVAHVKLKLGTRFESERSGFNFIFEK